MTSDQEKRLVVAVEGIQTCMENLCNVLNLVVDKKEKCIRMVDIDRGKVYKIHLGTKLKNKVKKK